MNHSTITELQKLNSIREKLSDILKKAFEKQKMYADRRKKDIDFYVGKKILIKINVRKDTFSYRSKSEGSYTILKKINLFIYFIEIDKNGKKQIDKKHV